MVLTPVPPPPVVTWDSIWLDAGGVLFDNVLEETPFIAELAQQWGLDPSWLHGHYADAQPQLEVGRLTLRELWRGLGGASRAAGDVTAATAHYRRHLRPRGDGWAFARWAASLGCPLVLANNEIREWDETREALFPSAACFQRKFTSWALGVAKPAVAFYAHCLGQTASRPERTLYFDDDAECVAAARSLGIVAHVWAGPTEARSLVLGEGFERAAS
jgi:putative hydrolase of the HAD superfamily